MKVLPLLLMTVAFAGTPGVSRSQEQTEAPSNPTSEEAQTTPAQTQGPPPNLENTVEAAEPLPRRDLVRWNEYQGPQFTIWAGVAFLYDFAAFVQDKESKEQIAMLPGEKIRDFRFVMGGRLPSLPLTNTTWCAGIMYDGPTNSWFLRQTGSCSESRRFILIRGLRDFPSC
jgi:phosphate-selective porin OprO/OprP